MQALFLPLLRFLKRIPIKSGLDRRDSVTMTAKIRLPFHSSIYVIKKSLVKSF
jgi:hypothetical protein